MILDISRGHIKVKIADRTVTIDGEMFFPENDKMGFVLYSDAIIFWDPPNENLRVSSVEKKLILDDIKTDFASGGHTLEVV
jgi:hypothetical protein